MRSVNLSVGERFSFNLQNDSANIAITKIPAIAIAVAAIALSVFIIIKILLSIIFGIFAIYRTIRNKVFHHRRVDEQLKEFFKSTEKIQKIFVIKQNKVRIIFNPKSEVLKYKSSELSDHIIIITEKELSKEVEGKIFSSQPKENILFNTVTFFSESIDEEPIFAAFACE